MFCTGGIRCEKASSMMMKDCFKNVHHLKGGILNYVESIKNEDSLWEGECFVFDDRITLDKDLKPTYKKLCPKCQKVINTFDRTKCEVCR